MAAAAFLRRAAAAAFLRRAAAAASSLALRRPTAAAAPAAFRSLRSAPPPSRFARFSSSLAAKKLAPPAAADLLKVIDDEIKCAVETDNHDRVEEIPDKFPFKIQDDKGMKTVTLKRTFQGEEVEVTVYMPSLVTGDKEGRQHDADDDTERPPDSCLPLTVYVTKGDGTGLEFSCTAFPDEVQIDTMSVKRSKGDGDEEMMAYEGPDFGDLDENLQKAFGKYLQLRGISPLNTNFLHEYMINKDSREYLLWLRNLKQFMQK